VDSTPKTKALEKNLKMVFDIGPQQIDQGLTRSLIQASLMQTLKSDKTEILEGISHSRVQNKPGSPSKVTPILTRFQAGRTTDPSSRQIETYRDTGVCRLAADTTVESGTEAHVFDMFNEKSDQQGSR